MAVGSHLFFANADMNHPIGPNAAPRDERNGHVVLDLADTGFPEVVFDLFMPYDYSGGNIEVKVIGQMTSATTGDVDLKAAIERIGTSQDIDSNSFGTDVTSINNNVPATAGIPFVMTLLFDSAAEKDSVAAGEWFRLYIARDGATDTAAGDYEFAWATGVEVA